MTPLLRVSDLSVAYGKEQAALKHLSFEMHAGEVLGIVGESGSGKSTLLRALLGMLPSRGTYAGGDILFQGQSVIGLAPKDWSRIRGKRIAMVFQDSGSHLNPIRKIGSQYEEAIRTHIKVTRKSAQRMAVDTLSGMGLADPERVMKSYPNQLSGGMKQRVAIAMAVTMEPELLLADEPTSALDVSTQAEVMKRLRELSDHRGTGVILVTHNIAVAAHMADRIGVMQSGEMVEYGRTADIITSPQAPYTRKLLNAVPELEEHRG